MASVGVLVGLLLSAAPIVYVRRAATKRVALFEEQFPEAVDLMARSLRAGHALTSALQMVGEEMQEPVGTEFRLLFDRQNFGMSLPDALKEFGNRIPLVDARFFVTAVLIQRESGGNLSQVLDNLASVIRERFKVKRQVRVMSAHGRITGWVLGCLPTGARVHSLHDLARAHHAAPDRSAGHSDADRGRRASGGRRADHSPHRGRGVLT